MSLSDIIVNFNKYTEEFVTEIVKITNDADVRSYKTILVNLNKTNATKCIEQFIIYALPEKDKIISSNEDYFLKRNYDQELDNDQDSMMQALKLKDTWKTFDCDTKKCIFEYLQVMVHYSEEYLKCKYNK